MNNTYRTKEELAAAGMAARIANHRGLLAAFYGEDDATRTSDQEIIAYIQAQDARQAQDEATAGKRTPHLAKDD